MLKKYFIVIILILGGINLNVVHAQTQDEILVDLADEMFGFGDHEGAMGIYLQAIVENENNVRAHFMAGRCYLKSVSDKASSLTYLEKALELDPEVDDAIHYYLGEAYRFNNKFEEAIASYQKYGDYLKVQGDEKSKRNLKIAEQRMNACKNAEEIKKTPVNIEITNLGSQINSYEEEYGPALSADENILIFTGRRSDCSGPLKDRDNKKFEDIFIARKEGNEWKVAENMGNIVNKENEHDASIGISPDGKTLYIYKGSGNGDIYQCKFEGTEWSKPHPIKEINTKDYRETSISATQPGRIYFCSDRPGGIGGQDIYFIEVNEKGKWGKPSNLGNQLNTPYDEESPYFDINTNTLYFSSKGHNNMGGYDIFKSTLSSDGTTWSKPENIGYPINTSDDDLYFTMSGDGERGYYSSFKKDGQGGNDLYMITFNPEKEEPEITTVEDPIVKDTIKKEEPEPQPVKLVVSVVDYESNESIDAQFDIVVNGTENSIQKGSTNNGEFSYTFNDDESISYDIYFEKEGYTFKSITLTIPARSGEIQEIHKTVSLRPQEVRQVNILRNIYFDFDKHSLKSESYVELDKLLNMLNTNSNMTIEIAGHTDFVGSHGYNLILSKQRASAVVSYLKSKGIASSRIKTSYHGETKPIASNDDFPELNRRTEFIILTK